MSLAYDIVVSGVLTVISICVHLMAASLFGPDTVLHAYASSATNLNGAERADLWYHILVMWVPLGGILVAGAWPMVRAYRRQAATAASRVPR